jgi:inorganic phosphate transporter, PiT family
MVFVVIVLAAAFGLVNGVHDAGNAIAAPVVTRALRPGTAVVMAAVFHVFGALAVGTAVAATIGSIISVPAAQLLPVLGAAVTGALVWNTFTLWRGLPCSSGHCLVGALAGAGLAAGGLSAVNWGGLSGVRPVGVVGSLVWLLVTTIVAVPLAAAGIRLAKRVLRRATREVAAPVRNAEIGTSAALAFAHGSNDAQKTMGLITLALVASGHLHHFSVPFWVVLLAAAVLTAGTSLGGWRVVSTLGRRIYPLHALEGFVSQGSSASVVLVASVAGAPVSTTDVVAPSVVGVGAGERLRHVRWAVVGEIGLAWLVTLPVSGLLAALAVPVWRWA